MTGREVFVPAADDTEVTWAEPFSEVTVITEAPAGGPS